MKKSFLLLCLFLQAASTAAQDANPDLLRLRALNTQVVEKYKANELNDALRSGKEALALSVKLFGENNWKPRHAIETWARSTGRSSNGDLRPRIFGGHLRSTSSSMS